MDRQRKIIIVLLITLISLTNLFAKTYTLREALSKASEIISKKVDGKVNNVAIVDIFSDYDKLSEYVSNELIHEFSIDLTKTNVVERNSKSLTIIEKEFNYQYSGNVSDETVQSMGKSLGADCLIFGSLKEDSSGWKLELRASHIESKKVIASWKGNIKKNDKDIQFQIKKSTKTAQKKEVKLIDPTADIAKLTVEGKKFKKIASMFNTNLSYNDIVEVFLQRFGYNYALNGIYVVSTQFFLDDFTPDEIKKRKGEYAWGVYSTDDDMFTILITNAGLLLLSSFYNDGQIYGSPIEQFTTDFSNFLNEAAFYYKAAGKSFSYEELEAYNNIFLGFKNSLYFEYSLEQNSEDVLLYSEEKGIDTRGLDLEKLNSESLNNKTNIIDEAIYDYNNEMGISSNALIEMCVKAGFIEGSDGDTLLHKAVLSGKEDGGIELTKFLLNLGIDINKTNKSGETALISAIRDFDYSEDGSSQECAEMLIKAGADVNIKDDYEKSAIVYAAGTKVSNKFMQLLINNGANVNETKTDGTTALMSSIIQNSINHGDGKGAELLIKNGADVNIKDIYGRTALMYAAQNDEQGNILTLIIVSGGSLNDKDMDGNTALLYAQDAKNITAEKILRKAGAK